MCILSGAHDMCAAPKDVVEEMTVHASAEQLGNLVNAMGRSDVSAAAVIAFDIAAGGVMEKVKAGGGILESAKNAMCSLLIAALIAET